MPAPWTLSERALRQHVGAVGASIQSVVDARRVGLDFQGWGVGPLVTAILIGQDCERASRGRGPDAFVAPLRDLGKELWAWLGVQEEWSNERSGKRPLFSFRSIGLTVHFGYRNEATKPQVFRAEWSGCSKWNGSQYGFQAGDAGHPHWQFDALESLWPGREMGQAEADLELLKDDTDGAAVGREFGRDGDKSESVEEAIRQRKLSRIHFPSAATWWMGTPHNVHAHSPASVREIEVWTQETLSYALGELGRL